jgi:hypothetical protein
MDAKWGDLLGAAGHPLNGRRTFRPPHSPLALPGLAEALADINGSLHDGCVGLFRRQF